jgi:hypothetical protein
MVMPATIIVVRVTEATIPRIRYRGTQLQAQGRHA